MKLSNHTIAVLLFLRREGDWFSLSPSRPVPPISLDEETVLKPLRKDRLVYNPEKFAWCLTNLGEDIAMDMHCIVGNDSDETLRSLLHEKDLFPRRL